MPKPYVPNDKWSKKASAEGYRARSVYKLMELDAKFRLIKPGMRILDIGAYPGSWLQYAAEKAGEKGRLIGVDLQEIEPVAPNVSCFVQDALDEAGMDALLSKQGIDRFDLILSDLAPKTSGVKDIDQWRSIELSHSVLEVAAKYLKRKGTCVMKVFRGADFDEFFAQLKREWKYVKTFSAQASRDRSREIYVIASESLATEKEQSTSEA